ncbi:hypothetical protein IET36_001514 [Enterococcus faecalis]|nr:hypothetical protein [Enterococcus faecalis]
MNNGFDTTENDVSIVIYFNDAKTALFQRVTNFKVEEDSYGKTMVIFDYLGQSTQTARHVVFNLGNIAGYARSID